MTSILVTGSHGQLASELAAKIPGKFYDRNNLDITDQHAISRCFAAAKPDIVINTAAFTAVDKAEQEPASAFAINRDGAKFLAQACARDNIPMVHISTDYVFDGQQSRPYRETDAVRPINVYGQSKFAGEEAVREYCQKHFIIRTSGIFSVYGNNIVKTILRVAKEKKSLRFIADQITCPTPAEDIANAILHMLQPEALQKNAWGTYHYCSADAVSWHGFAAAVLEYANLPDVNLQPISAADYPTAATRPAYSVLDCHKISERFSIEMQSWREGLGKVVKGLSLTNPP